MNVLFIHQNYPGQYPHLSYALAQRGDRVVALGTQSARAIEGVDLVRYDPQRPPKVPEAHPWTLDFQTKVIRAEACAKAVEMLVAKMDFQPDVVLGHPGWGELLCIKDVLPKVPVIHQQELFYRLTGTDTGFDPEFTDLRWPSASRLRLRRATQLLSLQDLDYGIAPTWFQWSTIPGPYRDQVRVIHEGIDTQTIKPQPKAYVKLERAGLRFQKGDEVISLVNRSLEPMRGFHVFMRALPALQKRRPNLHVIIVGGHEVSYGTTPHDATNWKEAMLCELEGQLDLDRIHFVGRVAHSVLHKIFNVVRCHVYLTYPFVLSWSLMEAMACEAVVVGSATPPVQEVIEHKHNGLLVDFFDVNGWVDQIDAVLSAPDSYAQLGVAARRTIIENYDLHTVCLPQQLALVQAVAERKNEHYRPKPPARLKHILLPP